jgi:hypothetical protein
MRRKNSWSRKRQTHKILLQDIHFICCTKFSIG